jgi:hypothetical protein
MRRLAGVLGLAAYLAVYLTLYIPKIVLPMALPAAVRGVESMAPDIRRMVALALPLWIEEVGLALTLLLWVVWASAAYGLLRLLGAKPGFKDALLLAGNYYYIEAVTVVALVASSTPSIAFGDPVVAAISSAIDVAAGSALLAYLFARAYNMPLARAFAASLASLVLAHVAAMLINAGLAAW